MVFLHIFHFHVFTVAFPFMTWLKALVLNLTLNVDTARTPSETVSFVAVFTFTFEAALYTESL